VKIGMEVLYGNASVIVGIFVMPLLKDYELEIMYLVDVEI
jgi:hypothetical protein